MNRTENGPTRDQMVALQALYSKWRKHSLSNEGEARTVRIAWASEGVGRAVSSFSELSRDEARLLIDNLKGTLGQSLTQQPRPWRRVRSRERAQAAGTAGRKDTGSSFIQMASADDLARIDELLRRLCWTREQFEAWLKSARSPLDADGDTTIRTVRQANRVYWALKAMLRRAGCWYSSTAVSRAKESGGGTKRTEVR